MACLKVCDQSITLVCCKTTCDAPSLFNHVIGLTTMPQIPAETLWPYAKTICAVTITVGFLEYLGSISPYNIHYVGSLTDHAQRMTSRSIVHVYQLILVSNCLLHLSWTMRRRPVEVSETARPWISQSLFSSHHSASTLYRFLVPHTLGA